MSRMFLLLGLILVGSALTVIYIRHLNRIVFVQAQTVQHQRDELNIEWRKLLIEQATWSVHRVEHTARTELNLKVPSLEQTRFVQTGEVRDG